MARKKNAAPHHPPASSTSNGSSNVLEVNKTIPVGPSLKRAREPSPEPRRSKRLRARFGVSISNVSGEQGNVVSQTAPKKQRKPTKNMKPIQRVEQALNYLSIDRIRMDDIADQELKDRVQLMLGTDTIKNILIFLASGGLRKHRPMVYACLENIISQKRDSLKSQHNVAQKKLQIQSSNKQTKVQESQIQPMPQPMSHIQPVQRLAVAVEEPQSVSVSTNQQKYILRRLAKVDITIVGTARAAGEHPTIRNLARVKLAQLATHPSMYATFYHQLYRLASQNDDLSAIALLFGFRAQLTQHRSAADSILRCYISGPSLDKLLNHYESPKIRRLPANLLEEVIQCIDHNDRLTVRQSEMHAQDVTTQAMETNAERHEEEDGSNIVDKDMISSNILELSEDKSLSSPRSLQVGTEANEIVQVWQLPLRQQQLQSTMFNLHYQTDIIRCLSCGASGHCAEVCTAIPVDDTEESCELCGNFGPDKEQCGHLWRPTAPALAAPTIKPSTLTMSCYNCGSNDHWGDDCNAMSGMLRH